MAGDHVGGQTSVCVHLAASGLGEAGRSCRSHCPATEPPGRIGWVAPGGQGGHPGRVGLADMAAAYSPADLAPAPATACPARGAAPRPPGPQSLSASPTRSSQLRSPRATPSPSSAGGRRSTWTGPQALTRGPCRGLGTPQALPAGAVHSVTTRVALAVGTLSRTPPHDSPVRSVRGAGPSPSDASPSRAADGLAFACAEGARAAPGDVRATPRGRGRSSEAHVSRGDPEAQCAHAPPRAKAGAG